ncbi:MAG: glycosyltransferase family 8 protein [Opitutales bacterium]
MNIVLTSNRAFLVRTFATIFSIEKFSSVKNKYFILIEENNKNLSNRISQFSEMYGFDICYIEIDRQLFNGLPINSRISSETYFRLAIPTIFKGRYSELVYVDSDFLFLDDIERLIPKTKMEKFLSAVPDPLICRGGHKENWRDTSYFNAGLLVFNLNQNHNLIQYAQENIRFILSKEDPYLFDQDILNYYLNGDFIQMPYKWNMQTKFFKRINLAKKKGLTSEDFLKPAAIHFSGNLKPWIRGVYHPYKDIYLSHLSELIDDADCVKKAPLRVISFKIAQFLSIFEK